MIQRAAIFRSTSIGDFCAGLPFLVNIINQHSNLILIELSRSGKNAELFIPPGKKIKIIRLDPGDFVGSLFCLIKNQKYYGSSIHIYFATQSRISIKYRLLFTFISLFLFRNSFTLSPQNSFKLIKNTLASKNQEIPITNVSLAPFLSYDISNSITREECIDFLKLPRIKTFLNSNLLSLVHNSSTNVALFVSAKDQRKIWGFHNWSLVLSGLVSRNINANFFLIGGNQDISYNLEFIKYCSKFNIKLHNFAGQLSPRETLSFLKFCSLYLGHDAAPMHMAALQGCHCISTFCNWEKYGLWEPLIAKSSVSHRPSLSYKKNENDYCINKLNYIHILDDAYAFFSSN